MRDVESTQAVTFGDLLRRHRLAVGLTQEALAERAGLSVRAITDLERGVRRAPYRDTVQRLAAALGLNAESAEELRASGRPPRVMAGGRGLLSADVALVAQGARLPAPHTTLIGRDQEIGVLRRLVTETRLLTLIGPG